MATGVPRLTALVSGSTITPAPSSRLSEEILAVHDIDLESMTSWQAESDAQRLGPEPRGALVVAPAFP